MLALISGEYNSTETYDFARGGAGKFLKYSTMTGLCVPKECTSDDLKLIDSHFINQAVSANWTNVAVSYNMNSSAVSDYNESKKTAGYYFTILTLIIFIFFGILGALI